jgi:hypothetical protein
MPIPVADILALTLTYLLIFPFSVPLNTIGNYSLLACYDHIKKYSEGSGVHLYIGVPVPYCFRSPESARQSHRRLAPSHFSPFKLDFARPPAQRAGTKWTRPSEEAAVAKRHPVA